MKLIADNWLSTLFQYDVYRLEISRSPAINAGDLALSLEPTLTRGRVFIYLKTDVRQVALMQALADNAFRLVDTNIVFTRSLQVPAEQEPENRIRPARPADKAAVERLAENCLVHTRFHLDPQIPNELAGRVKRNWAGNFFSGQRGDTLLVAEMDGTPTGFLLLLHRDQTIVVDLIAVDPKRRRMHIGRDLIHFARQYYGQCRTIQAGTQLANGSSLEFYQNLGFRLQTAQHVFHLHRG